MARPMKPIADGAYLGIAPICECGHYDGSHETSMSPALAAPARRNVGPCHAPVAGYGTRCDCAAFVNRT